MYVIQSILYRVHKVWGHSLTFRISSSSLPYRESVFPYLGTLLSTMSMATNTTTTIQFSSFPLLCSLLSECDKNLYQLNTGPFLCRKLHTVQCTVGIQFIALSTVVVQSIVHTTDTRMSVERA